MSSRRGQFILGGFLVGLGVLLLLGMLLHINVWAVVWSAALIALGILLLVKPGRTRSGTGVDFTLIGDTRLQGAWQAENREIWHGIGDVRLDFSAASIPEGETTYRIYSFIGDIDIIIPPGVGLTLSSSGLFCELKLWGQKQEGFLRPLGYTSPDFATTPRRIRVESVSMISDVSVN